MSRLKNAEDLINSEFDETQPSITEATGRKTAALAPDAPKKSVQEQKHQHTQKRASRRFTLTIQPGSMLETALDDYLQTIPENARKHVNLGAIINAALQKHDAEITKIVKKAL